ncbi:DUF2752 domain-containing protein [Pedobacter sp. SL55]|uniref:DUF2752 domain-containing protein n=1 Tax=Pedobacter sp. SL55 TaxID=2995161 RepID=UPI00226F253E|nr:DUF2752 domain-containing protein [Pedobacter sp. SL55]WAC41511.1 DUF2752 domain-containing protein [Pedobacter sp. SL55]
MLILSRADIFLLPCPFKYLFGFDCPGCGFQRSVLALFNGDFVHSFQLYPPTVPFLLSFIAGVGTWLFKFDQNAKWLKVMYFFTGFVMVVSYLYKMLFQHIH